MAQNELEDEMSSATASASGAIAFVSIPETGLMIHPLMDVPSSYCSAIGEIAARWNWLENQLGVIIREGFELDKKEGRVLTVGMGVKPKCNILRMVALKWITDRALQEQVRQLAKDCQNMIDPRNEYVHGLYGHPVGQPNRIGRMIMGSGEERYMPKFMETSVAQIQQRATELREIQQRAQAITRRIKELREERAKQERP